MPRNVVSLTLGGDRLEVEDLARGMSSLSDLMQALAKHYAKGKNVRWMLEDLRPGSATAAIRGVEFSGNDFIVQTLIREFEDVGRTMKAGSIWTLPYRIRKIATDLKNLVAGHVTYLRFEGDGFRVEVDSAQLEQAPDFLEVHGEVRGRVQSMSARRGTHFVLYETNFDTPVKCYLKNEPGTIDSMREVWGRMAKVTGVVTREAGSGAPIAVRDIRSISRIDDGDPNAFLRAKGAVRPTNETPVEDVIRKLR